MLLFPRASRVPFCQDTQGMNPCGYLFGTFLWLLPSSHLDHSEGSLGVSDGQGGLVCCDSWSRKGSDTTERLNWTEGSPAIALYNVVFKVMNHYHHSCFAIFPFYSELILSPRSMILVAHLFVCTPKYKFNREVFIGFVLLHLMLMVFAKWADLPKASIENWNWLSAWSFYWVLHTYIIMCHVVKWFVHSFCLL